MAKQAREIALASLEVRGDGCEEKEICQIRLEHAVKRLVRAQPSFAGALFFTDLTLLPSLSHSSHSLHLFAFRTSACQKKPRERL
jgi:hypothetical protein